MFIFFFRPVNMRSLALSCIFRARAKSIKVEHIGHRGNEDLYQKLLEIEKEIVREVARGDKPYLRKSTDRKAQISPLN